MGPICGYAGEKSREKVEIMLSASRYRGARKLWQNQGIAIGQVSPELELQLSIACDGRFYSEDIKFLEKADHIAIKEILPKVNGDYALAIAGEEKILLARDPIGARALYYGFDRDGKGFAFASEKAMLRAIAIAREDIRSLPPGSILTCGEREELNFREKIFQQGEKLIEDETQAINLLRSALERAIQIRVKALMNKKMGILFSGGIDSSTLASKVRDAKLYVAGIPGSHDLEQARLSARALGLAGKMRVIEIDFNEIEAHVPEVISIIENANPMDVELGLTLFFATRAMSEDGIQVAISGQGSDELFGGYTRYATILKEQGENAMQNALLNNVKNIAVENLERDLAIAAGNSLEMVMPYLDKDLITLVLGFNPKLKIRARENAKGYMGKYVLRKLAEEFIPGKIAWKDKKAMQYGSGMHAALKAIARKNGFTGAMGVGRYLASIARERW